MSIDSTVCVTLSKIHILELIEASNQVNANPTLREARSILRRMVRETKASNDPKGSTT